MPKDWKQLLQDTPGSSGNNLPLVFSILASTVFRCAVCYKILLMHGSNHLSHVYIIGLTIISRKVRSIPWPILWAYNRMVWLPNCMINATLPHSFCKDGCCIDSLHILCIPLCQYYPCFCYCLRAEAAFVIFPKKAGLVLQITAEAYVCASVGLIRSVWTVVRAANVPGAFVEL